MFRSVTKSFHRTLNHTKKQLKSRYIIRYFSQDQQDSPNKENEDKNNNEDEKVNSPDRLFIGEKNTIIERDNYVESMTPKKIVESLNKYIIGQNKAKKAVAVSLRNRWRRQQLDDKLRKEVSPMNILMMGPTGSGKTEIARRLAQMVDAPFVKTEATKYTEVGIVGQSAEECVKDLIDKSVKMEREKRIEKLKEEVNEKVEKHILSRIPGSSANPDETKRKLRNGELDNNKIEVASFRMEQQQSPFPFISSKGINILNMSHRQSQPRSNVSDNDKKRDRVPVSEAREIIKEYELSKSLDENDIRRTGVKRAEESGIIFLDEIDKLCDGGSHRGDYKGVKGEGVQKELLGLIEGTTVQTENGIVNTDHMLFICAGAFHSASPSDLLPELQGRVPIRVNLEPLTQDDFYKILTDTESNLLLQQQSLFAAEGVDIEFENEGIKEIAKISKELNESLDNIGARRLRAVISKIVEELSYNAPDQRGTKVIIDKDYVREQLSDIIKDEDLSKYIL